MPGHFEGSVLAVCCVDGCVCERNGNTELRASVALNSFLHVMRWSAWGSMRGTFSRQLDK